MRWNHFFPATIDESARWAVEQIPGVKVDRRGVIAAPPNASSIVAAILDNLHISFHRDVHKPEPVRTAWRALPILRPGVAKNLMPFQRRCISQSVQAWCNTIWAAPGSGKTRSEVIWGASEPGLIVAVTRSGTADQWAEEANNITTVVAQRLEGELEHTRTVIDPDARFLVIGYDVLPAWTPILIKMKPASLILDEIHHVSSHKRWNAEVDTSDPDRHKVSFTAKDNIAAAAMALSQAIPRRLGATATPIGDRPRNLWAQLDLIHPWQWGNYRAFCTRYAAAHENAFGGFDTGGKSNLDELAARCRHVTSRVSFGEANASLPPKRRLVTYVRVRDQVKPEAIGREMREAMKLGGTAAVEMKVMEAAARKRKIVMQRLEECIGARQKVIVFTGRRRDCDKLRECVASKWPQLPSFGGHGEDSKKHRNEQVKTYMATPGPCVFIGTLQAFGEGYNLQDTDRLILAMLPYTVLLIEQAEGRPQRLGMTRPVLIEFMICEHTIDEHVAQILISKLPAVDKIVGGGGITGLDRELIGADDDTLVASLAAKILGETQPVEISL